MSLTVSPVAVGPNLDAKFEVYRAADAANGLPFWTENPNTVGWASGSKTLAAGTYYVKVSSYGQYGDVGQYTVAGAGWFDNPSYTPVSPVVNPHSAAGAGLLAGPPPLGAGYGDAGRYAAAGAAFEATPASNAISLPGSDNLSPTPSWQTLRALTDNLDGRLAARQSVTLTAVSSLPGLTEAGPWARTSWLAGWVG